MTKRYAVSEECIWHGPLELGLTRVSDLAHVARPGAHIERWRYTPKQPSSSASKRREHVGRGSSLPRRARVVVLQMIKGEEISVSSSGAGLTLDAPSYLPLRVVA